jgi:tetratricopeptide (TPR) repeat protein
VGAAVTGTLLRAGTQVRVAVQLVEAPGGRLIWSGTQQVTLNDIFQLQDDLTRHIVDSLSLPLSPREERMLSRDAPANAQSYEYFLRANQLASDPKSWAIARDLFRRAVEEDPRYPPIWAHLGRLHRKIAKYGGGGEEDLGLAEVALHRALELNPELPIALNLSAQLDIDHGRPREAMVTLLGQARRRSTDPELYGGLVFACRYCGLLDASLRAEARARHLDPSIETSVIHTHWMSRRYESVLATTTGSYFFLRALAFVVLGREPEALALLIEKENEVPARIRLILTAARALVEGRRAEAVSGLQAIVSGGIRDAESKYYVAGLLGRAGAAEDGVTLLDRAASEGCLCYPAFASDIWLDPLRGQPRFAALLDRVKQEQELAIAAFAAAGGDDVLGTD